MRMLAKLFHADYQVSEPIYSGPATIAEGGAVLHRSGQPSQIAAPGESLGGAKLTLEGGVYRLDGQCMVSEQTHWVGWRARPGRKKGTFYLEGPERKIIPAQVGQVLRGFGGRLDERSDGHLEVSGRIIWRAKKVRELSLVVFDKQDDQGHIAYFNVLEKGRRKDPNGTQGRFIRDAKGARFCELGGDDAWHDTARFYDFEGAYVRAALRTLPEAERSAAVAEGLSDLAREAKELGIDAADLEEYDALFSEGKRLGGAWNRLDFVVGAGREWVRPAQGRQVAPAPF